MKFKQNYIENNGVKANCYYNMYQDGTIYITEDGYGNFRDLDTTGFTYENNSDSQSDYFERGRLVVKKGHKFYEEAKKAMESKEASREKRRNKIKLEKALELESAEEIIEIKGSKFIVVSKETHPRYSDMIKYTVRKARSKKLFSYSKGEKTYIPLHAL